MAQVPEARQATMALSRAMELTAEQLWRQADAEPDEVDARQLRRNAARLILDAASIEQRGPGALA